MRIEEIFECKKCGNCCRVEGYVPLTTFEITKISRALGIEEKFLINEFIRLLPDRNGLSLKEKNTGECIFLQSDNKCAIHEEKPRHCKDFPMKWHFSGYKNICLSMRESHELQSN